MLYRMLQHKLPDDTVHGIIRGAVAAERRFICDALSCDLIGMNSELMTRYIEFVADRLLAALGHPKLYGASNPFDWMELISLQGKTNFFEKRVGEYQKAGVMSSLTPQGGGKSPKALCWMQISDAGQQLTSIVKVIFLGPMLGGGAILLHGHRLMETWVWVWCFRHMRLAFVFTVYLAFGFIANLSWAQKRLCCVYIVLPAMLGLSSK